MQPDLSEVRPSNRTGAFETEASSRPAWEGECICTSHELNSDLQHSLVASQAHFRPRLARFTDAAGQTAFSGTQEVELNNTKSKKMLLSCETMGFFLTYRQKNRVTKSKKEKGKRFLLLVHLALGADPTPAGVTSGVSHKDKLFPALVSKKHFFTSGDFCFPGLQ